MILRQVCRVCEQTDEAQESIKIDSHVSHFGSIIHDDGTSVVLANGIDLLEGIPPFDVVTRAKDRFVALYSVGINGVHVFNGYHVLGVPSRVH